MKSLFATVALLVLPSLASAKETYFTMSRRDALALVWRLESITEVQQFAIPVPVVVSGVGILDAPVWYVGRCTRMKYPDWVKQLRLDLARCTDDPINFDQTSLGAIGETLAKENR